MQRKSNIRLVLALVTMFAASPLMAASKQSDCFLLCGPGDYPCCAESGDGRTSCCNTVSSMCCGVSQNDCWFYEC
jgi:hypothetical protein